MPSKDDVAKLLADAHSKLESTITRIVRLVNAQEADEREPVKLLEVNSATSPSGVLPIAFGPDGASVPFASVVVEVTPDEFASIERGDLQLPEGWTLGTTLHDAA